MTTLHTSSGLDIFTNTSLVVDGLAWASALMVRDTR